MWKFISNRMKGLEFKKAFGDRIESDNETRELKNMLSLVRHLQKRCRFWSDRREREVEVQITYDLHRDGDCTIYSLNYIEELW